MALAGKSGKVSLGANDVAELKSWSLDLGSAVIETTSLGAAWKSSISGLKEWKASADGNWIMNTDTNGQTALQNAYLNGTTVTLKLYVNATNYYSGSAFVSGIKIEDSVSGIVTANFDFAGTGALAYS